MRSLNDPLNLGLGYKCSKCYIFDSVKRLITLSLTLSVSVVIMDLGVLGLGRSNQMIWKIIFWITKKIMVTLRNYSKWLIRVRRMGRVSWDGPRPSLRASDRPIRRADIKDKIYIKNHQMGQSEIIFLNLTVLSTLT